MVVSIGFVWWVLWGKSAPKGPVESQTGDSSGKPATSSAGASERLPGLSVQMMVRLNHQQTAGRKYLFDFGTKKRERFSIYVTADNIFTVLFVDAKGEPHPITHPLGGGDLPFGKFVHLNCEVGCSSQTTHVRLNADGRSLASLVLPFRTDLGELNADDVVVGADLSGKSCGFFDLAEVAVYGLTIRPDDAQRLSEHFHAKSKVSYVEFRGGHWMRRGADGNMEQPEKQNAPIFRKL